MYKSLTCHDYLQAKANGAMERYYLLSLFERWQERDLIKSSMMKEKFCWDFDWTVHWADLDVISRMRDQEVLEIVWLLMVCGMQKLYLVYKISGGYLYILVVSELGAAICEEIAVRTPLPLGSQRTGIWWTDCFWERIDRDYYVVVCVIVTCII